MRTFWLNFHRPYRCRHSLACCTSGWPIPIERDRAARVEAEIAAGRRHPLRTPWLSRDAAAPAEMAGMLEVDAGGRCVFLKADSRKPIADSREPTADGRCTIYPHRPLSCVHFPYVCLIDQRGVHVTLSHYCPTAASLLFEHTGPVEIVEGPSPVPELEIPEGLDARESLPPLAASDRLMTFEDFAAWEREQVHGFTGSRVQGFKGSQVQGFKGSQVHELFEETRSAVAPPLSWPAAPDDLERAWTHLVAPAWESFASVIHRYLAARLFASWAAYLGDGLDAVLREAEIADAVLTIEAIRQCAGQSRRLDAALLKQAVRQSDLLLVHYADRERLSRHNRAS